LIAKDIFVCYIICVHGSVFFIHEFLGGIFMSKKDVETKKKTTEKKNIRKQMKDDELKRKKELEEQIDELLLKKEEAKKEKNKDEIKKLNKEIKELKSKYSSVGKETTFTYQVKEEMKLVRWPSAKEVLKYSIAVLVFIIFFGLFFYVINLVFAFVKGLF